MRSLLLLVIPLLCALADTDRELRKSIDLAMKCQYREPPRGPVIAVTPARFAQIVVILHERFGTPACFRTFKSQVNVSDEKTWPFCVFGKCSRGRCQCAEHFVGPKCSVHKNRCWLLYCYLTSCHPNHQSLHCLCDPSLYGTRITSGIYWYNEGKSSKYVPPPSGWHDQPTGVIRLESDSNFGSLKGPHMPTHTKPTQAPNYSSSPKPTHAQSDDGSKELNQPGRSGDQQDDSSVPLNSQRKRPIFQKARVPGFDSGGRMNKLFGPKGKKNEPGAAEALKKVTEKSDVEVALEELEEVSGAAKWTPRGFCTLMMVIFYIHRMHGRYRT